LRYLHTMVRVSDLSASLDFYCGALGLKEFSRRDYSKGRFTLVFLGAPDDLPIPADKKSPLIELTYNWDSQTYERGRNFGHIAFQVDDIYLTCNKLMECGVVINRPPRDGRMAFVRSPDDISIELLQKGEALDIVEPWSSMSNVGEW
jgi:lactoylglutathione lyase